MNEYARVLQLEFNRGTYQGNRLISDALFTAQGTEPFPNAAIGVSPFASAGLNFHYGLSAWLECPPPAANCGVLSSPGAFGFTPWVDREGGYYAIIAMEIYRPAGRDRRVLRATGAGPEASHPRRAVMKMDIPISL